MTMKLTPAQLDEIEATAKDEMDSGWRIVLMNPAATLALVAEVRELRARLFDVSSVVYAVDGSAGGTVEYCHPDTREWRDVAPDLLRALGEEA